MKNINNLKQFSSAYDLIEAWFPGFLDDYEKDKDFVSYVKGFDAFESMAYFLVNNDYVITADDITGAACGSMIPVSQLFREIKAAYQEERG